MMFRDDECRIRTENAPDNFVTLKHMALNLIRQQARTPSASGVKSPPGTTNFSSASSPRDSFTRFPWGAAFFSRWCENAVMRVATYVTPELNGASHNKMKSNNY